MLVAMQTAKAFREAGLKVDYHVHLPAPCLQPPRFIETLDLQCGYTGWRLCSGVNACDHPTTAACHCHDHLSAASHEMVYLMSHVADDGILRWADRDMAPVYVDAYVPGSEEEEGEMDIGEAKVKWTRFGLSYRSVRMAVESEGHRMNHTYPDYDFLVAHQRKLHHEELVFHITCLWNEGGFARYLLTPASDVRVYVPPEYEEVVNIALAKLSLTPNEQDIRRAVVALMRDWKGLTFIQAQNLIRQRLSHMHAHRARLAVDAMEATVSGVDDITAMWGACVQGACVFSAIAGVTLFLTPPGIATVVVAAPAVVVAATCVVGAVILGRKVPFSRIIKSVREGSLSGFARTAGKMMGLSAFVEGLAPQASSSMR